VTNVAPSICGFLVVRRPEENFDADGRGAFTSNPPRMFNYFYGGIDRMAWFDAEEDCFTDAAPPSICKLLRQIRQDNANFTGIDLCRDYTVATALLEYSNRLEQRNEIIAVYSDALMNIQGLLAPFATPRLVPLGYDVVAIGGWSLLRDGLFVAPSYFERWLPSLTPHGLLDQVDVAEFLHAYGTAAESGAVEPLDLSFVTIDAVQLLQPID
jgi:hypothetical protein